MVLWRLLNYECFNPRLNLSIEESVFRLFKNGGYDGVLWLWRNNPSVIISYSQNVMHEVNLEFCKITGIEIVRRLSGGGAVYHDMGVINISLVVNIEKYKEFMDVEYAYKVAAKPLVNLLRDLGINVEFKASNSVFTDNFKIAGFAQYRSQNTLLVHSSILFDANLSNLYKSLINIKYPVVNISSLTGEWLDIDMFKKEIIYWFSRVFNVKLIKTPLTSKEVVLASKLYALKYSNILYNISNKHPNVVVNVCLPKCFTVNYVKFYEDLILEISRLYKDINLVIKFHFINDINKPLVFLDGEPMAF